MYDNYKWQINIWTLSGVKDESGLWQEGEPDRINS